LPGAPDQDGVLSALVGNLDRIGPGGRVRRRLRVGGFGLAQAAAVARHELLDVTGEVVPQVPAVGDLDRSRCTLTGAVGVGAGAVAAHHLGAGVLPQPVGEGVGVPVAQQVHRAVGGHVDQDGAVVVAAAQREVVDAEHGHAGGRRVGQRAEQAQQGAAADRQPEPFGQPCPGGRPAPGRPARSMRRASGLRRAYGVVRPGICSAKVRTWAAGVLAEEPADR
jgi:hypothetical protein